MRNLKNVANEINTKKTTCKIGTRRCDKIQLNITLDIPVAEYLYDIAQDANLPVSKLLNQWIQSVMDSELEEEEHFRFSK